VLHYLRRAQAKEKGLPAGARKAPGKLVEGGVVQGWKAALGALALTYPDRLAPYLV
jgi:putative transposase